MLLETAKTLPLNSLPEIRLTNVHFNFLLATGQKPAVLSHVPELVYFVTSSSPFATSGKPAHDGMLGLHSLTPLTASASPPPCDLSAFMFTKSASGSM